MDHRRKAKHLVVSAMAVGGLLLGLGSLSPSAAEAQTPAMVRAVHMAPGAPNVDIAVDGQRAFSDLAFKSATQYAPVPAGSRNVKVTPAGQAQPVVIDANLDVPAGKQLTVVATGELPSISPVVLQDDNSMPPAGQAKVRFVHASPDAPAVDVAAQGGPVLFRNVAFRSVGEYANVPAGTYTLEVRPAGQSNAVLTVPNVTLSAGQIVTIFAAGKAGDNSLAAVPVSYQQQVNGMPAAGAGAAIDQVSRGWWIALVTFAVVAAGALRLRAVAVRNRG